MTLGRLILAASVGLHLALGGPALGQSPARAPVPAPPAASMQMQLGAIPLAPPRALEKPAMVRVVRLTQLSADQQPVGAPREIICPDSGCHQMVSLTVANTARAFVADIQFVGHGAYLVLESRSIAVAGVVEFGRGRPGPIFIRGAADSRMERQLRLVTVAPESVRALDAVGSGRTIASGNVFTRKIDPDVFLHVEILPQRPAG